MVGLGIVGYQLYIQNYDDFCLEVTIFKVFFEMEQQIFEGKRHGVQGFSLHFQKELRESFWQKNSLITHILFELPYFREFEFNLMYCDL